MSTNTYIDDRLANAIDASKYRATLYAQKNNIKLKYEQSIIYAAGGGLFKAEASLISFVSTLVDRGINETVIIDVNNNPIYIEDLETFLSDILDLYAKASNIYLQEYKKIQSARKIAPMIGV